MIYALIALTFALAGGLIGRSKGGSFWLWFLVSGVVPVLGLVAAVLYRSESDELRRQCPRCGGLCMLYDAMCMRCGCDLEFPEQAVESAAAARDAQRSTPVD